MSRHLYAPILHATFEHYEGRHASGQQANNKLVMENLLRPENEDLLSEVVDGLSAIVRQSSPEFVTAVPNGANWLGKFVAEAVGVEFAELSRDVRTKNIQIADDRSRELITSSSKGAMIEDVINRLSNTRMALRVFDLRSKINLVAAAFDRGSPAKRLVTPGVQILSLAHVEIPALLPDDSKLWHYEHTGRAPQPKLADVKNLFE